MGHIFSLLGGLWILSYLWKKIECLEGIEENIGTYLQGSVSFLKSSDWVREALSVPFGHLSSLETWKHFYCLFYSSKFFNTFETFYFPSKQRLVWKVPVWKFSTHMTSFWLTISNLVGEGKFPEFSKYSTAMLLISSWIDGLKCAAHRSQNQTIIFILKGFH